MFLSTTPAICCSHVYSRPAVLYTITALLLPEKLFVFYVAQNALYMEISLLYSYLRERGRRTLAKALFTSALWFVLLVETIMQ